MHGATSMRSARVPRPRGTRSPASTPADAPRSPVAQAGPSIRPRLAQSVSGDGAAPPAGIPVQRMLRGLFGFGSKKTETPREPERTETFGSSPIPMSSKNFIPDEELHETNQRQARILAEDTKKHRDSYIAPHQRRADSLLATSKASDGSPIGGTDYSQAALDGVMQGVAENLQHGVQGFHQRTQDIMDASGKVTGNQSFDDFYAKHIKSGFS